MTAPRESQSAPAPSALARVVGVPGAVFLGLGSIVGTGVFVSIGTAAGVAGDSVVLAVMLASVVATCNGLSSAQLAANHPVSGGTYEYGHRYLNPTLGFVAGWLFLCAKSASAATAALGFAAYLLQQVGRVDGVVGGAIGAVAVLTTVVASGMKRSSRVNTAIVLVTLLSLLAFVVAGATRWQPPAIAAWATSGGGVPSLLHATALMFVAYTGYGRIATLGEEVRDPRRSIPRAMVITLVSTMLLYGAVAAVAVGAVGARELARATEASGAPLVQVVATSSLPQLAWVVTAAAIIAMLGVLLNLLLGLSRVVLAMARRGDMPAALGRIEDGSGSPARAVVAVGVLIAGLCLLADVKTTWSFSAFTVLVYYALTNLAALRLSAEERLFPRWVSLCGLVSCASLAFFVEPHFWLVGVGVTGLGLLWRTLARLTRG